MRPEILVDGFEQLFQRALVLQLARQSDQRRRARIGDAIAKPFRLTVTATPQCKPSPAEAARCIGVDEGPTLHSACPSTGIDLERIDLITEGHHTFKTFANSPHRKYSNSILSKQRTIGRTFSKGQCELHPGV